MEIKIHNEELESPISLLEEKFGGADALIRAAFACSYFTCPNKVRAKTPLFPDRARYSREHYPDKKKGEWTEWGNREVKLDDNSAAHRAWEKYTGHALLRKSGYGLRHIWGHPWNPDAFTADWNLCYMPFWAGMLTEKQHPHEKLECAFRQASWNLYFAENSVCNKPDFVENPEMDLDSILDGRPILILEKSNRTHQNSAKTWR